MRYFKLSDGRKVKCGDSQAVSTLIKWGNDNKIGVTEYYRYKTPDNKHYEVDAWARTTALNHPKLKGAIDLGAQEERDHPYRRDKMETIQAAEPEKKKSIWQKAGDVYLKSLYTFLPPSPLLSAVTTIPKLVKSLSPSQNKNYIPQEVPETPPIIREAEFKLNEAVTQLESLQVSRPPADQPELEAGWRKQYDKALAEARKQQENYMFRVTGLNEAQRETAKEWETWAKKYPFGATLLQLPTGFEALWQGSRGAFSGGGAWDDDDNKTGEWYAKRKALPQDWRSRANLERLGCRLVFHRTQLSQTIAAMSLPSAAGRQHPLPFRHGGRNRCEDALVYVGQFPRWLA